MTVLIIEDLSGASGSPTPVSAEETHIQVRLATWQALEAEDLLTSALERADALKRQLVLDGDDDLTALLLAVSDNGTQMIAASTRRFMAMVAIAQHFGRPATATDQTWIESRGGTIKAERPHLLAITDPAVLTAEPDSVRLEYNSQPLHPGHRLHPPLSMSTKDADPPSAKPARTSWNKPPDNDLPTTERQQHNQTNPEDHNDA
ncbi:hypothetical protein [Actinomyces naeslundii]|uniref:Uncharacterized protein n=1 Tax=Actinomyces naeslundii (strain ATCC 12104 / DSM 43013 / CCUG 2238 / JCM 8349 / NCTC 10301 / Howell 279) TaxID=1115803 RepID=J3JK60_ACTNH|nr:hypothetical protein [Actinomyces naeslundii]EJN85036.1 hypothetical protein HMPREF1129_0357 [Actinomyces naeslundii str. Howell 279]OMG17055.1 hypothetical protein BKH38_10740 [Actinomyces naeslundii]QQC21063.1 hypothetical protein I6H94_01310 [Actinomyces naeslundii]